MNYTIERTPEVGRPYYLVARSITLKDVEAANLFLAAPDMYEAIKLLQAALTEHRLRDVKKRSSLCIADAAACAAIAKAEGTT